MREIRRHPRESGDPETEMLVEKEDWICRLIPRSSRGRRMTARMCFAAVFLLLIILFIPAFCFAEEKLTQEQTGKITLNVNGAEINEIFKVLSNKSGVTIVSTPAVQGRISLYVDNLSLNDALDVIMTMQDLAYERKGNLVKVMTAAEFEKNYGRKFSERKETRTIKLAYAKPSNVMTVINTLKSSFGKIISDEATGIIIVTDIPESLEIISSAIKELDKPLESAVFNINYARFADLKGYLNDLITPGLGQIIVDERSSKVVVTDLPARVNRIKKLMKEFDEESRQVLISGEIVEVTISDDFKRGIDWDDIFSQDSESKVNLVGKFPVSPELSTYGRISVGTISKDHNKAVINMLSEYGSTKTLTRPRIVAVNKDEAKLLVGTREAYITGTQSQATSTTVTSESVEFVDVGVKLSVIPTIGSDDFITMKIKPEVSSVQSYLETDISKVPIVQTAQSETVVKVKNGSTLIIAGLMKNTDMDNGKGLPKLGKVPFIGGLFGNKTAKKERTELVIFITPTIINNESSIVREIENEKK